MNVPATHEFWRGKRVFLTGHTGFKGGWLALWLQQMGAEVTGYSLAPNTDPSLFDVAQVSAGMTSIIGDIRDYATLQAAIRVSKPEVVFHLAAQPLVRLSYAQPRETYETNVMGTVNLLDALRHSSGVRAVVIVTSDKCYENRELGHAHTGYREGDAMGGYDPYSNSKGCVELVTSAFRQSYFHPDAHAHHSVAVASARAGNVIGGGDWCEDRLIPDFIRAMTAGTVPQIRNPHATRPWQHVLEPVSGYIALAEKLVTDGARFATAWNFGPANDDAKPVEWIAERMVSLWGEGAAWQLDGKNHPHEATFLKLDSTKARQELDWQARLSLDETLAWLVEWYRAWALSPKSSLRDLTLKQIAAYEKT